MISGGGRVDTRRVSDKPVVDFSFLIYPALGLVSGFLAGLLGIGGGLVIVPALMLIFSYQGLRPSEISHAAVATSLAAVIFTSVIAAYSHHRRGAVDWSILRKMATGLLAGALFGAMIASSLPGKTLRIFFGLFAFAAAIQMGFQLQPAPQRRLPAASGLAAVGAIIGMISAIVGIGGGTVTVPFLRWRSVAIHRAVATSSACGFPIAVGGCLGFTMIDLIVGQAPSPTSAIYWPAALWIAAASLIAVPAGVRVTHRISILSLTRIFACILAIIGLRLVLA